MFWNNINIFVDYLLTLNNIRCNPDLKEYRCIPRSCSCESGGPNGKCSECSPNTQTITGTWYFLEKCNCNACTGPF
jgi:hypothetical protein